MEFDHKKENDEFDFDVNYDFADDFAEFAQQLGDELVPAQQFESAAQLMELEENIQEFNAMNSVIIGHGVYQHEEMKFEVHFNQVMDKIFKKYCNDLLGDEKNKELRKYLSNLFEEFKTHLLAKLYNNCFIIMGCHPGNICLDHQIGELQIDDPFFDNMGPINSDELIKRAFMECLNKNINLDDTRMVLRCIEIYYILYKTRELKNVERKKRQKVEIIKGHYEDDVTIEDLNNWMNFNRIDEKDDAYYLSVSQSANQIVEKKEHLKKVFSKIPQYSPIWETDKLFNFMNILSYRFKDSKGDNADNKKYGLFKLNADSLLKTILLYDEADPTYSMTQGFTLFNKTTIIEVKKMNPVENIENLENAFPDIADETKRRRFTLFNNYIVKCLLTKIITKKTNSSGDFFTLCGALNSGLFYICDLACSEVVCKINIADNHKLARQSTYIPRPPMLGQKIPTTLRKTRIDSSMLDSSMLDSSILGRKRPNTSRGVRKTRKKNKLVYKKTNKSKKKKQPKKTKRRKSTYA